MHKLYELKEMLCDELEEYGQKGKLDVGSLDVVDKLAHAIKNIDKIIEAKEGEEYSNNDGSYRSYRSYRSYGNDGSYRNDMSMNDGSYARGRGANAKRDTMGRYSRNNDFMQDLRDIMEDAPNDSIRQKIQSIMKEM